MKIKSKLILKVSGIFLILFSVSISAYWFYKESKIVTPENSIELTKIPQKEEVDTKKEIDIIPVEKGKEQKEIPNKKDLSEEISKINFLMEKQLWSVANSRLLKLIKKHPKNIKLGLILGDLLLQKNELEKLKKLIINLKDRFGESNSLQFLKIRLFVQEGRFDELQSFLEKNENKQNYLKFYQAILLSMQNNHKEAKKILDKLSKSKILQKNLTDDELYLARSTKKKSRAIYNIYDNFNEFKDGENPHLFTLLSKSLLNNSEPFLAKKFANIAILDDFSYVDAWILRGYANYILGDLVNALGDMKHAYDLDPVREQTHYLLGLILYENNKTSEAALFLEKSLEYDFTIDKEIKFKLLDIYTKQKKYKKVFNLYQEILNKKSTKNDYTTAIHTAINLLKRPDLALEYTQKLIEKNPQDVFTMNLHAWALLANKKILLAEKILNNALSLDKNNARTFLNIGLLNEQKNELKKAKDFYYKSYQIGKNSNTNFSITGLAARSYNRLNNNSQISPRKKVNSIPNSP
jgi:lipopolysaccharide biosynthesis regulator YciM